MSRWNRGLSPFLFVGILLLGVGGALVYWRDQRSALSMETQQGSTSGRNVLYWHDPMVPNARFERPGKSPFMDMQLVPVYADDVAAAGAVRVDPNVAQNLGMRTGKVERIRVQPRVTVVGAVAFDDRLLHVLPARADGVVLRLHVRTPLEPVRKGDRLATVQVPQWTGAQREYLALLDGRSDASRSLLAAARERLSLLGVPESTVRRIEANRRIDATTTLVAPADGVVSELGVREGSTFERGDVLFRINGLASVWVNARIPESQISAIPVGATAIATAPAWPGEALPGKVLALLPEVDAATRTMTARVALDNRSGRLAPGMFVSLSVAAPQSGDVLVVPSEAIIRTGTRTVVVTVNPDRTFGTAEVQPGAEQDDRTVIVSGLAEGQSVVLSGQFLIDSEASLKSTLTRLAPARPTASDIPDASAPVTHRAEGVIVAVESGSVTIDHGAVTSLQWPAMSMRFDAPSDGLPSGLAKGDRVAFAFVETQGGYRISAISKVSDAAATGRP